MNIMRLALIAVAVQVAAVPQRAASIEGAVVKLGSGEALANATVQLNLMNRDIRQSGGARLQQTPSSEVPPKEAFQLFYFRQRSGIGN